VLVKSSSIGTIPIIRPFNIVVVDVNDVPTNVIISNNTIIENNVANAFIGTLITTDQDVADTFTYSFSTQIGTNDNAMFNIVGDQLYLMVSSDFEDKNQLVVHVKTQDQQGLNEHVALSINVIDINEAPQLMPTTFFVDENLSASASIGTLEVLDQDGGDGVTLSVLGDGKAYFTINSGGALQALVSYDYETQKLFEINVLATDIAGLTDIAQVQVFITDVFEAGISLPTIAVLSPNGDGKNDNFTIDNVALYSNCSLQVFNTAGSVVYSVDSNYDNSWNGTYKGQSLDNGTYYYLLQSNDEAGVYFNGSFTIFK